MDYEPYTRSEFADNCGLHRAAVTKAIRRGAIWVDPDTDKIDPSHPTNLGYIQHIITNKRGHGLTKELTERLKTDFQDLEKRKRKAKLVAIGENSAAATKFKEVAARIDERVTIESPEGEELFDELMRQGLLQPGEQLKIAQTTLANLRIAKEMDDLIVRSMVTKCFARLSGIISSRMLCLGQRAAKPICSLFGDMSPEKEIAVQKVVDDEVAGAVEAIQQEIKDATDW